jgi:hypothetical protein
VLTSCRLRSARRRVALLVAVWALSGVWGIGHAMSHAHEREHDEHHAAEVLEDGDVSIAARHDGHGHSHPDSTPIVSTGKRSEIGSLAILVAAPKLQCQVLKVRWGTSESPARAIPRYPSASGPRAPPIS